MLREQSQHSSALRFASKKLAIFFSNIHRLWLVAWLCFTDAAIVETVAPATSHSWIGQTVKLTCKADGSPTPTLSWKNPSGRVIQQQETELKSPVDVPMKSDQDFGNYTCEATNNVNTDTSTVQVQQISKWNFFSLAVYLAGFLKTFSSRTFLRPIVFFGQKLSPK